MKQFFTFLSLLLLPLMVTAQGNSPSNMKLFPFKNDSSYVSWPMPSTGDSTIYSTYEEMISQIVGEGISGYTNEEISMFGGSPASYHNYLFTSPKRYHVFYFCKFAFDGPSDIGIDTGWVLSTGPTWPLNVIASTTTCSSDGMGGIAWPAIYNSGSLNYLPSVDIALSPFPIANHEATFTLQDPDLANLIKDSVYQANVLEFDFIPLGDSIALDYVFASEEYPNFHPDFPQNSPDFISTVCDEVTDVMGIFISGPGFNGSENIALIPGTDVPVGINTITPPGWNCPGMPDYSEYYVDNSMGQNVIFNGFTTVLTAKAAVIPGETYHIRIGVADASKHTDVVPDLPYHTLFDSGVFVKNGSLRSWSDSSVSINEKELLADINIHPNPFTHSFSLELNNAHSSDLEIYMYDVLGKEILRKEGAIDKINQSLTTEKLSLLNSGFYVLKIKDVATGVVKNIKLLKK